MYVSIYCAPPPHTHTYVCIRNKSQASTLMPQLQFRVPNHGHQDISKERKQ